MFDFVKNLTISLDPFGALFHQYFNVLTLYYNEALMLYYFNVLALYHDEEPLLAVSVDDCEELLYHVNTLP